MMEAGEHMGKIVLEAHVELYHGGKNEDGATDEINIPFLEASDTWMADEITWNNQPWFTPGGTHFIDLLSQSWSASDDYKTETQVYFDDPSSHRGIVVYWVATWLSIEKGFSSNNSIAPSSISPRLMISSCTRVITSRADQGELLMKCCMN